MTTAQSKTFEASPEKVWGAVLKIINASAYTIGETNAAAKQVVYKASGGGWAWSQLVTISVSGVEGDERIVTVRARSEGQATLTEGGQQKTLIRFVFDQLERKFSLAANQKRITNAPGSEGCWLTATALLLCLVSGLAGTAYTLLTLVSRP